MEVNPLELSSSGYSVWQSAHWHSAHSTLALCSSAHSVRLLDWHSRHPMVPGGLSDKALQLLGAQLGGVLHLYSLASGAGEALSWLEHKLDWLLLLLHLKGWSILAARPGEQGGAWQAARR